MAKNITKKFAIGAGIAAVVGYVAGILTAPKSGKETRADVKDAATKGIAEAEKDLKKLHAELDELVAKVKQKSDAVSGSTRKEFDKLLDTAKVSKEKASELIAAVRNGKADDKDLKKAVSDATKAIDHLRDYLSK